MEVEARKQEWQKGEMSLLLLHIARRFFFFASPAAVVPLSSHPFSLWDRPASSIAARRFRGREGGGRPFLSLCQTEQWGK